MREVLRHRDLRLLLLGQAVSQAGDWLYSVALIVFVLEVTGSPAWVAAVEIARLAPWIAIPPVAGLLADRVDRRRVLIAGDIVQLVAMIALAAVAATGADPVLAVAVALVASSIQVVASPSLQAAIPQLVDERGLASVNALLSAIMNLAIIVGPAIGAVLLILGSPATAFALNGITFLVSAACFALVRTPMGPIEAPSVATSQGGTIEPEPRADGTRLGRRAVSRALRAAAVDLGMGFDAIRGSVVARAIVLATGGTLFVYGMQVVLWAVLATERTEVGSDAITMIYVANGIGGLLATIPASRARSGRATIAIVAAGCAVGGASVAALAIGQGLPPILALIAIQGLAISIVDILALTQIQRIVGPAAIGRVLGLVDSVTSVAMVAGTILAPVLVAAAGVGAALVVAGCALAVVGIAVAIATRHETPVDAPLAARTRLLAGLALFTDAPRFALEGLASAAREMAVATGTDVIREGDAADAIFVVVDGSLDVSAGPEGRLLNTMRGGDFFGEIGILKGVPRTATVTATTACTLLRIERDAFTDLVSTGVAHGGVLGRSVGIRLSSRRPAEAGPGGADTGAGPRA